MISFRRFCGKPWWHRPQITYPTPIKSILNIILFHYTSVYLMGCYTRIYSSIRYIVVLTRKIRKDADETHVSPCCVPYPNIHTLAAITNHRPYDPSPDDMAKTHFRKALTIAGIDGCPILQTIWHERKKGDPDICTTKKACTYKKLFHTPNLIWRTYSQCRHSVDKFPT